jgi:hypothetical protein
MLNFSPHTIRVIRSRRMKCGERVVRMGEDRCLQDFDGEPEEKTPL